MEINGSQIYQRIVDMIKMRGIKKTDFYDKIGISSQHMMRWRCGSLPSVDILYLIKEELNVSLDWLLTGNNNQDATDLSAPFQIVNRIEDCLERKTHHKKWESNYDIYAPIRHIVKPQDLGDWLYGRQAVDISKVAKIADVLGESVQYLITGSPISKEEYTEKYFGDKETKDANFYREYSCLTPDNKETVKHITDLLFHEQIDKR